MIKLGFKTDKILYSDCYLSVSVETDRFFYGIFNDNHTLLETGVVEGVNSHILRKDFKKKIVISSGNALHLPATISDINFSSSFLQQLPSQIVFQDKILEQNAISNYLHHSHFQEDVAAEKSALHLSTAMAYYLYPATKNKTLAFISDDRLHFCHYNQNGLQFYNQYHCAGQNDYLYFLLSCYKMQGLSPETDTLEIAGRIAPDTEVMKLLHSYFSDIYLSSPSIFNIGKFDPHLYPHYYLDLYMAYLCVL